MKYDPRLKTFVEDDYRYEDHLNFKKQIEDQKYNRMLLELENQFKLNQEVIALLTEDEAIEYMKTLDHNFYNSWKNNIKTIYSYTDPVSSFAGNIYDSFGVARVVNDLRSFGVEATEYFGKDGKRYIKLSGYPGVRNYLNATRYLANNPRIVSFGVGTLGIEAGISQGARFGIVFSAAYRLVELIFKDEYGLVDLFVNLTIDGAKLAISVGIATAANTLLVSPLLAVGGSLMLVALGVFAIGFLTSLALYWLDDHFKISETIIKNIKSRKVNPTPYHPDQFFNMWGRLSRG
ncbi:hypothetical protein Ppb6_02333 [Photorhabdus australis subsp. thailandensis]|uniref:Uncharacterized protein n=1 Tax=Photorhabdus australis subsp. thailandensis TaxID=2805096 RepID=A0A1C0U2V1_9GAMM|nr:hypothetical protein [Photorhabdus australis]OCQ52260.1 hypothetical protein Ppb6_02333 [Photorhabdus australis subsp. thailandensis]